MRVIWVVSFLLAPVTYVCAQDPNDDIKLNVPKLVDFTTHFSARPATAGDPDMDSAPWFEEMVEMDLQLDGNMALNVVQKTLDMSMHFTDGNKDDFSVRISFDGAKGNAAIAVNTHVNTEPAAGAVADACAKITVPPAFLAQLPPSDAIKKGIEAYSPQANAMVNMVPHANLSYENHNLLLYIACIAGCTNNGRPVSFAGDRGDAGITIAPDGTPFGIFPSRGDVESPAELVEKIKEDHSRPVLQFDNWTSPGLSFAGLVCNPGPDTKELMEQPRVRRALLMAERILESVERTAPIRLLSNGMFTQVPQLFLGVGGMPAVERAAPKPKPVAGGFGLIFVAAVAFASAAVGALASRWTHGRSHVENGYGQLLA